MDESRGLLLYTQDDGSGNPREIWSINTVGAAGTPTDYGDTAFDILDMGLA